MIFLSSFTLPMKNNTLDASCTARTHANTQTSKSVLVFLTTLYFINSFPDPFSFKLTKHWTEFSLFHLPEIDWIKLVFFFWGMFLFWIFGNTVDSRFFLVIFFSLVDLLINILFFVKFFWTTWRWCGFFCWNIFFCLCLSTICSFESQTDTSTTTR